MVCCCYGFFILNYDIFFLLSGLIFYNFDSDVLNVFVESGECDFRVFVFCIEKCML